MKKQHLFCLLFIGVLLDGCTSKDEPQRINEGLAGSWQGANEIRPLGRCSWTGDASVSVKATFQVTDSTITGRLVRGASSVQITGKVDGTNVRINENSNVICDGVPGTYTSRYEGLLNGNTLTLTSRDTLCPKEECIFLRTLKLARQ